MMQGEGASVASPRTNRNKRKPRMTYREEENKPVPFSSVQQLEEPVDPYALGGPSVWHQIAGLDEVLEDLSSRFILNLPEEELASPERVCFQVEQAHWFYEDFLRTESPHLPSFNLKAFSSVFFAHCPLLSHWLEGDNYERLWERFMKYKNRVPVCGGILLDRDCGQCVLVKGWKSNASWGFPKGKINDKEEKWKCAVREVFEEIGYDITHLLNPDDYIEVTMNDQRMTLYVVPGVPLETFFETQTRKEISAIEWTMLSDLPTWKRSRNKVSNKKFYSVAPFVAPLKQWIDSYKASPGYSGLTRTAPECGEFPSSAGNPEIQLHEATRTTAAAANRKRTHSQDYSQPMCEHGETLDTLFGQFPGIEEGNDGSRMQKQLSGFEDASLTTARAVDHTIAMQALLSKLTSPSLQSRPVVRASPQQHNPLSSEASPSGPTSQPYDHTRALLSSFDARETASSTTPPRHPVFVRQLAALPHTMVHTPLYSASAGSPSDEAKKTEMDVRRQALLDDMMADLSTAPLQTQFSEPVLSGATGPPLQFAPPIPVAWQSSVPLTRDQRNLAIGSALPARHPGPWDQQQVQSSENARLLLNLLNGR